MAFEGLTEKLSNAFKKLRGKGRLSESRRQGIHARRSVWRCWKADVNFKVVKDFIKTVNRALLLVQDVLESLTPAQHDYQNCQ